MVRKLATRAGFAARIMSGRSAALSAFAIILGVIGPAAAQPRDGWPGPATPGQGFGRTPWPGAPGFTKQDPRRASTSFFAPSPRQESYTSAFEAAAPSVAPPSPSSFAPAAPPRAMPVKARPAFAGPAGETAAPRSVVHRKIVIHRKPVATHRGRAPKRRPVLAARRAKPPILSAPTPVLASPILAFTRPTPQRGLSPLPEPVVQPAPSASPPPPPQPQPAPVVAPPIFVAPAPPARTETPALKPARTKVLRAILRRPEKARRHAGRHGAHQGKHRRPGFKGPDFTKQPPNYISPYVATNHTDGPPLDWPPQALRICDGPKAKLIAACRDLAATR